MKKLIFIVLLFISTPCLAENWTSADTNREAAYLVLHGIDWAQTRYISRNPDKYREQNSIVGHHPHTDRVDAYFILTGLAHVYVASILSPEWRRPFQYVTIGLESGSVVNNFNIGVKVGF